MACVRDSVFSFGKNEMNHRIYQAIVDAVPDMLIRISRKGVFQSFEGATAEL